MRLQPVSGCTLLARSILACIALAVFIFPVRPAGAAEDACRTAARSAAIAPEDSQASRSGAIQGGKPMGTADLREELLRHCEWLEVVARAGFPSVTGLPMKLYTHRLRADLRRKDLAGASLRGVHLGGARLGRANLERADLREALLEAASFFIADLGSANLIQADLRDADLARARLNGAEMYGTGLRGARFASNDTTGLLFEPRTGEMPAFEGFESATDLATLTYRTSPQGLIAPPARHRPTLHRPAMHLRAWGWVWAVGMTQSLISTYLTALWALTWLGRPFG